MAGDVAREHTIEIRRQNGSERDATQAVEPLFDRVGSWRMPQLSVECCHELLSSDRIFQALGSFVEGVGGPIFDAVANMLCDGLGHLFGPGNCPE